MNSRRGTLFVVTGPSGVGKGTVLAQVFATTDRLYYSISVTTRRPRDGERHGVNYLFCERDALENMIRENALLEHAEYVGNIYGTPIAPVELKLEAGIDVILELEVQGALSVKAKRHDAVLIFLAPPNFEELERRLKRRGTDSEQAIEGRMKRARQEYEKIGEFDYIVTNDNVIDAADEMRCIIKACRCLTKKRIPEEAADKGGKERK